MNKTSIITLLLTVFCTSAKAQLFHPLGLGSNLCERQGNHSQPKMHVEGDKLYVCTSKGLYAKDLAASSSEWQPAGFDGIPLQDYARRADDILALRNNQGGGFLLLSHDGGQTYEDVTPEIFKSEKYDHLINLVQHPSDPNTLLVLSLYHGMFRSADFGQTWENLTEFCYGNVAATFIGFHSSRPNIIYNSGEGAIFEGHINISYDSGQTWTDHGNSLGFPGDNCVHQVVFHPSNPDRWLAGGEGAVFLSDDNGQTWSVQNYWSDLTRCAYWFFSAFDTEHPDTVYMAGCLDENIKLMCSTNGGHSWHPSQKLAGKHKPESMNDLQQFRDRLLIYTETDVYEVSKAELVSQSATAIRSVVSPEADTDAPTYDLQGRRIVEPTRGIFIRNGRKIIR